MRINIFKNNLLTHCDHVIYTVVSVTDNRKSWLMGPISPAAGGPLYQQIVDRLKREVSEGRLAPGAALPSFRLLAEELLVSVITVKRAYEELEREGIIFRRQGLGTFVAEGGHDRSRETKLAAAKDLLRAGFREAAEAGLNPAEIVELSSELLKETQK
jgi:GntR family transcriptional regulator